MSYEEGGSNGLSGLESRSSAALLLTSKSLEGGTVGAWCLSLSSDIASFHLGEEIVAAAFCCPHELNQSGLPVLPFICMVSWDHSGAGDQCTRFRLSIESISDDTPYDSQFSRGDVLACTIVDIDEALLFSDLPDPALAMGTLPLVFLLCFEDVVVFVLRKQGILRVFNYDSGTLSLIGQKKVNRYVVDAAIQQGSEENVLEVTLLLCSPLDTKDGCTAIVQISRVGCML